MSSLKFTIRFPVVAVTLIKWRSFLASTLR